LYKGASSPLAGAMAHNAGLFFAYGQSKAAVARWRNRPVSKLKPEDCLIAGASTGFIANLVECPIDLLKVKLQAQVGKGQYAGVWDCLKQIIKLRGFFGIYQGFTATIMRNVPCFALYFYFFELVKQRLTPEGERPTSATLLAAGGAAGFGFWGLVYPLDIIKTRMQGDALLPEHRSYKNTFHCISQIMNKEGVRAFYKGYVPSIVRAIPVNATVFLAVNKAKSYLFDQ